MRWDRKEIEANAKLIAAAPDLLAACVAAREFAETAIRAGLGDFTEEEEDEIIQGHAMIRQLDAAIKKARGE